MNSTPVSPPPRPHIPTAHAHRVHWEEGMLLAPQHLRQLDHHHDQARWFQLQTLSAAASGVATLTFDGLVLREGTVSLNEFAGTLPDGTALRLSQSAGTAPPARTALDHFPPDQTRLGVYLGVRRFDPHAKCVAADTAADSRFVLCEQQLYDEAAPDQPQTIRTERPNARILFGTEERGDFSTIKIGELVRATGAVPAKDDPVTTPPDSRAGGAPAANKAPTSTALELDQSYLPPLLWVNASEWLTRQLAALHDTVIAQRDHLRQRRQRHHAQESQFRSADILDLLRSQLVETCAPVLTHMLLWPTPPDQLYSWLVHWVGHCQLFSDRPVDTIVPFDPSDLRACLAPLIRRLQQAMEAPLAERCLRMLLHAREDGVHHANWRGQGWPACSGYFLAVRSRVEESHAIAMLPGLAKVAAWSRINQILSAASPGVPLRVCLRPPAEVPASAGSVYFQLLADGPYWAGVMREENIALHLPAPFDPAHTKVELFAIPTHSLAADPRDAVAVVDSFSSTGHQVGSHG